MARRDEITRMAREAFSGHDAAKDLIADAPEAFERFADMVAAAWLERCAKACDAISDDFSKRYGDFNGEELGADTCAEAIRALKGEVSE